MDSNSAPWSLNDVCLILADLLARVQSTEQTQAAISQTITNGGAVTMLPSPVVAATGNTGVGAWTPLSLSGILPSNATAVILQGEAYTDADWQFIYVNSTVWPNGVNLARAIAGAPFSGNEVSTVILPVGSAAFAYKVTNGPGGGFTSVSWHNWVITILGYVV